MPTSEEFRNAFRQLRSNLTQKQLVMLRAHYHSGGRAITESELAAAASYSSYRAANLQYGALARKVCSLIEYEPPSPRDGRPLWPQTIAEAVHRERYGLELQWVMRPEAADALADLGIVREERVKTRPVPRDWYGRLKANGFTADAIYDQGQHEELKKLLFQFGGEACVLVFKDPDKERIISRGILIVPTMINRIPGDPCECHKNSAKYWKRMKRKKSTAASIMTGYALSEDGVWRQHTWALNAIGDVVESTEERVGYFGFALTEKEAQKFYEENR